MNNGIAIQKIVKGFESIISPLNKNNRTNVINRADIGNKSVTTFCKKNDIPVLMEIPYDKEVAVAYSKGIPITDVDDKYKNQFLNMYNNLKAI